MVILNKIANVAFLYSGFASAVQLLSFQLAPKRRKVILFLKCFKAAHDKCLFYLLRDYYQGPTVHRRWSPIVIILTGKLEPVT